MTKRHGTAMALFAAALLVIGPGPRPAAAQQQTYDACYVPAVGALYLIGLEGLPTECLDPSHVAIRWSEGGEAITDHGALSGLADDDHPEYVREGEAAGGDLTGAFPDPSVAALQGNALSTAAPSHGQVLTWDGTGTEWSPQALPSGVTDHGELSGIVDDDHGQYLLTDGVRDAANGFAVTGTSGSGTIPVEGGGARLMWYPGKRAFRAGEVSATQWDDDNVGLGSVALGYNATASGFGSTATGHHVTASTDFSTAMGSYSVASGQGATAVGSGVGASGDNATALGDGTTASGHWSTAMGRNTTASGRTSTATGEETTATGDFSTAMGVVTYASAYASLVIGQYNVDAGYDPATWRPTDPLFVAGNGGMLRRSNALALFKNGDLTIAGTLTESSDRRLKIGIEPLGPALDAVTGLHPVRFRFRADTGHPTDPQIGLIAQDVAEAFPELVTTDSEGYLSLAYPKLTAVLVQAVQELEAENGRLAAENQRLAERLDRLEAAVRALEGSRRP